MNALILAAAILAQPMGELTTYHECGRLSDLKAQGFAAAGLYEGGGGERYQFWVHTDGRVVWTMTAPMVRGATCVLLEAKEVPEI